MQTMLKCFEFFSPQDMSLATRKIAFKIKTGADHFASKDVAAFMDYLGALMDVPEEALKSSRDQLRWMPVEGGGELPAEVIDLTTTEAIPRSLIGILLGNTKADSAEVLPDEVQGKAEVVKLEDALKDLVPNLTGQAGSDDDSLEETDGPTADTEPDLSASVIDTLTNAVTSLDALQSATSATVADTTGQNEEASVATEDLLNLNREKQITVSSAAKSQFKQIFYAGRNLQSGHAQTTPSEISPDGADTQENAEMQEDIKALISDPNTRGGGAQTIATENAPQRANTQETAEVQRHTKNPSLDLNTRDRGSATATPEIYSKGMDATKNTEAPHTTNGSSLSQAAPHDQPGETSLTTAKGEGNSVVNSADGNDTHQPQLQQNSFTNENGNSGQHEQSGSMFRQSYQSADAQLHTSFKEAATAPDSENVQSAVQDKDLQNDVMRQIVQRMNLRSDHLQSQMSIKLKPEFLGDLRLEISTAKQHVSIKMTAESTAVKEMIEANIAVLKTELQQHGLHIDKFDVFVGQESDAWKHRQQQTASRQERRNRNFRAIQSGEDEGESDTAAGSFISSGSSRHGQNDGSEIDFFA
jgi:flagellar hook-length control protein FliK